MVGFLLSVCFLFVLQYAYLCDLLSQIFCGISWLPCSALIDVVLRSVLLFGLIAFSWLRRFCKKLSRACSVYCVSFSVCFNFLALVGVNFGCYFW